jgi:WD40 repeat protein
MCTCYAALYAATVRAAATTDGTVRIWSASTGRVQRKLLLNGPCRALAWSPDGRYTSLSVPKETA